VDRHTGPLRTYGAQDREQSIVPFLDRVLTLLDAGRQPAPVRHDPHLDELHRLGLRVVPLGVLGTGPERHALHASRLEHAVFAEAVGVLERASHHVRDALDVAVRVHRPNGAGYQRVMVEDA
jgi:hypothetical protein